MHALVASHTLPWWGEMCRERGLRLVCSSLTFSVVKGSTRGFAEPRWPLAGLIHSIVPPSVPGTECPTGLALGPRSSAQEPTEPRASLAEAAGGLQKGAIRARGIHGLAGLAAAYFASLFPSTLGLQMLQEAQQPLLPPRQLLCTTELARLFLCPVLFKPPDLTRCS